jgi:hypothetical protein
MAPHRGGPRRTLGLGRGAAATLAAPLRTRAAAYRGGRGARRPGARGGDGRRVSGEVGDEAEVDAGV